MEFEAGCQIGVYRVIRPLGKGGMGAVYEVEHKNLGVHYALKLFSVPEGGHSEDLRQRFISEGKVLARLDHPNIARVIDLDYDEYSASVYYVMELVHYKDGESYTLADLELGGADTEHLVRWFGQLASALDYIHSKGIIHRDIKLNNILLNDKGGVVLTDFGISKFNAGDLRNEIGVESTMVTTAEGRRPGNYIMGTEGYMAPEILAGGVASEASDTYALAVAFFRLVTGLWYEPGTAALDLLAPCDPVWTPVLPKMLDADSGKRPTELTPISENMKRTVTGQGEAVGVAAGQPSRRRMKTSSLVMFLSVAVVAVIAAVGLTTRWFAGHSTDEREVAPVAAAEEHPKPDSPKPEQPKKEQPKVFDLGNGVKLEMLPCPAGGTVSNRYWLSKYPVTVEQWKRVVAKCNVDSRRALIICLRGGGKYTDFFGTLNRVFAEELPEGYCFRHPTEAEHKWAMTAGGTLELNELAIGVYGPSAEDKIEYFNRIGMTRERDTVKVRETEVGHGQPNAWGFYDAIGNGVPLVTSEDGKKFFGLGQYNLDEHPRKQHWTWIGVFRVCIGPVLSP